MFTICMQVIEHGRLEEELQAARQAERNFTREIGVLEREFYQCVQQPHVIWANTRWTSEAAHNRAAKGIMKVRDDDRVASAFFRPGLYFEIFAEEASGATLVAEAAQEAAGYVVICHGLVADRWFESWRERLASRVRGLPRPAGLLRVRTYFNSYCERELVGICEWADPTAYGQARLVGERSVEEHLFVGEQGSELAAYVQYECRPLPLRAGLDAGGGA